MGKGELKSIDVLILTKVELQGLLNKDGGDIEQRTKERNLEPITEPWGAKMKLGFEKPMGSHNLKVLIGIMKNNAI